MVTYVSSVAEEVTITRRTRDGTVTVTMTERPDTSNATMADPVFDVVMKHPDNREWRDQYRGPRSGAGEAGYRWLRSRDYELKESAARGHRPAYKTDEMAGSNVDTAITLSRWR
jgi:hypothetical protein